MKMISYNTMLKHSQTVEISVLRIIYGLSCLTDEIQNKHEALKNMLKNKCDDKNVLRAEKQAIEQQAIEKVSHITDNELKLMHMANKIHCDFITSFTNFTKYHPKVMKVKKWVKFFNTTDYTTVPEEDLIKAVEDINSLKMFQPKEYKAPRVLSGLEEKERDLANYYREKYYSNK